MDLFHETKLVISDPGAYEVCGRRRVFNPEDQSFMSALVNDHPHLFPDGIRDHLYSNCGVMTSTNTLGIKLRKHLGLTLQKACVSSAQKSMVAKGAFMDKYKHVPAEFLVFTGMSHCLFSISYA